MSDKKFTTYKDLKIWQQATTLSTDVYQLSHTLAKKDNDLAGQIRFSAFQVPLSIAAGYQRKYRSKSDYVEALRGTLGNLCQLETLMVIATDLGTIDPNEDVMDRINHLTRMIIAMIKHINHGGDSQEEKDKLSE